MIFRSPFPCLAPFLPSFGIRHLFGCALHACRIGLALLLVVAAAPRLVLGAERAPNILISVADDCTFSDLPIYGGQNAMTPVFYPEP